jgi:hypothetical protein
MTDRDAVARWVASYENLWRTPGTDRLGELFTADASYQPSPWATPLRGLDAIASFWKGEGGSDDVFTMTSEIVAVDGSTAVVRVLVEYGEGGRPWKDLWVLTMTDGRCSAFEEWPFTPGQLDGHESGESPSD